MLHFSHLQMHTKNSGTLQWIPAVEDCVSVQADHKANDSVRGQSTSNRTSFKILQREVDAVGVWVVGAMHMRL